MCLLSNIYVVHYMCAHVQNEAPSLQKYCVDSLLLQGYNALMCACEQSHLDIVQYLLEKGADASLTDKKVCVCNHTVTDQVFLSSLGVVTGCSELQQCVPNLSVILGASLVCMDRVWTHL